MATLTYNPDESVQGELNADEQESLAVGEQMEQQQQALLAGKFKDAEDLEKAYMELQSKLGQPEQEAEPEPEEQEEQFEPNFLSTLWEEAQRKEFSPETIKTLEEMETGELAKLYLQEKQANATEPVTEEQAVQLRGMVGGDEQYKEMTTWAADNFSENEIAMYDYIMQQGDPNSMYFAIQALSGRFNQSSSIEGKLITGKASPSQGSGFRSQAEVVRAMSDPRYDSDPAYRQDVANKLERSNINF